MRSPCHGWHQDRLARGPPERGNDGRAKRWGLGRKRDGAGRSGAAGAPASEGRAGFIGVLRCDNRSGEKRKPYRRSAAEAPLPTMGLASRSFQGSSAAAHPHKSFSRLFAARCQGKCVTRREVLAIARRQGRCGRMTRLRGASSPVDLCSGSCHSLASGRDATASCRWRVMAGGGVPCTSISSEPSPYSAGTS